MKNVIKKIASIAMAFTLLGTGTAVTKNLNPKFDNTLVASAACQYHDGSIINGKKIINYYADNGNRRCRCCKQVTGQINCKEHDWEILKTGKWYGFRFVGVIHADESEVYEEFRWVTVRCKKCDIEGDKTQKRIIRCYKNGKTTIYAPYIVDKIK